MPGTPIPGNSFVPLSLDEALKEWDHARGARAGEIADETPHDLRTRLTAALTRDERRAFFKKVFADLGIHNMTADGSE